MRKIILIRHGQTLANKNELLCGFTDLDLTSDGKKQIESRRNLYTFIDDTYTFYTSGLKRTNETLNILFGDIKYNTNPNLKELNYGIFEMKSISDVRSDKDFLSWVKNPYENVIPGGESLSIHRNRVVEAFDNIRNSNKGNIVIICHGGTIMHIMEYLFSGDKNIDEIEVDSGCGFIITDDNKKYSYKYIG